MFVWHQYPAFFRSWLRLEHRYKAAYQGCTPLVREAGGRKGGRTHTPARHPQYHSHLHSGPASDSAIDHGAQDAGAQAKRSGRAFEREIEEANALYERRGVAVIYRHYPPVEGWGRSLHVTGKGPADFSGVMRTASGPIAVAFDCKVITSAASYAHAERDIHQVERLLRFREAGGVAFLLLCCRDPTRLWLLYDLVPLLQRQRVRVRSGCGDAVADFLPFIEPSPLLDVAKQIRTHWDYQSLVTQLRP